MSFSSRRRNYLLTPHRRDGLIEWMKSMLQHSFVLDALETTGGDTFSHFEMLIDEHRKMVSQQCDSPTDHHYHHQSTNTVHEQQSRLKQLVPTIGTFHTHLPLREAFEIYNAKHKLTKRKHIQISFNEIRHILNLAQIMAMRKKLPASDGDKINADNKETKMEGDKEPKTMNGPKMITFDGDQTLYTDGANFESNPRLATYLTQLLKHGVTVAVVTAAGYEYNVEKYEYRLSGLLAFFKEQALTEEECARFYLFGGECNYLLRLGSDFHLHAVKEDGAGGWLTSTKYMKDSPANWDPNQVTSLLDAAEGSIRDTVEQLNVRGMVIRKRRAIGLVPKPRAVIPREVLDEIVLRVQERIDCNATTASAGIKRDAQGKPILTNTTTPAPRNFGHLPYCAFNGGKDCWFDVGNKRVGVQILQSYLGIPKVHTLHIGDQFLNTGNDFAARDVCPCIWITSPEETTYILKSILQMAGLPVTLLSKSKSSSSINGMQSANGKSNESVEDDDDDDDGSFADMGDTKDKKKNDGDNGEGKVDFSEVQRRTNVSHRMNVYTGEIISDSK